MANERTAERMERLVSLCKRRGFIFPASEIYGGLNGFWDYGPMGTLLKRNIKDAWWHDLVIDPPVGPDGLEVVMLGLDSAIIQNPRVWEASGHVQGFTDPMVDCRECKARFRADQIFVLCFHRDYPSSTLTVREADKPLAAVIGDESQILLSQFVARRVARQDLLDLDEHLRGLLRQFAPQVSRSVQASSEREATNAIHLTTKERRIVGDVPPYMVLSVGEYRSVFGEPPCPACGLPALTEARKFNMMFRTFVGAAEDAASTTYLRPETAQGIFANYLNVLNTSRVKIPFGIAQIGKAFRNEINPRNYTFRSREFEQMEIEFFCHPDQSMRWYEFWRDQRIGWYKSLGLASAHLRPREQGREELAHYSSACTDIEYLFPFSDEPQELEGVAHRGCYDLSRHQEFSGRDMSYFDDEAWERDKAQFASLSREEQDKKKNAEPYRFIPHVVEPSAGVDRFALAVLCEAFTEDTAPDENGVPQPRTVMKFHPRLAPVKVAVFPLVRRDGMPEKALALYRQLRKRWAADYDDKSAVGRRYRRHDEIGTPFCVTVDGQTNVDGTVTIRDRDSMVQVRVPIEGVEGWLAERLSAGQ